MKYNVFDKNGKWLGTVHAADPKEAIHKAIYEFKMSTADYVEERDEPIYRDSKKDDES